MWGRFYQLKGSFDQFNKLMFLLGRHVSTVTLKLSNQVHPCQHVNNRRKNVRQKCEMIYKKFWRMTQVFMNLRQKQCYWKTRVNTPLFRFSLEFSIKKVKMKVILFRRIANLASWERFIHVTQKDLDNFLLATINKNTKQ